MSNTVKELKDFAAKVWDMETIYDPGDMINQLLTKIDQLALPGNSGEGNALEKMRKALEKIVYGYDNDCGRPGVHIGYSGAREIAKEALSATPPKEDTEKEQEESTLWNRVATIVVHSNDYETAMAKLKQSFIISKREV